MRSRLLRIARVLGLLVLVLAALLLASFAIPLRTWRTGQLPAPPLPLADSGAVEAMPRRVWIDTDAACGHATTVDPDDCFAIALLARSKQIELVGISTVHGNAPLEVTDKVTRELVTALAREDVQVPEVHRGARSAETLSSTPARAALQQALDEGPMTVIALGPLTNLAAALRGRPDLQRHVGRIIAVMGRRPGHLFHPAEGRSARGMLFGHGPVFRDFNFDKDRAAATAILSMGLPITLIPYEAARALSLTRTTLEQMRERNGASRWIADRADPWLAFWNDAIGLPGFYPFDALAAAYRLEPKLFRCAFVSAWISKDSALWHILSDPPALLVGPERDRPGDFSASGTVHYCPSINPGLHDWLVAKLLSAP
jgi:purine nucleosidase